MAVSNWLKKHVDMSFTLAGVQRNRGLGAQSRRETGGWWLSLAQDSAAFAERESGEFSESSKH